MLLAWQSKSMPVMHIVFNNSTAVEYILLSASLLSAWLPAEGWSHGMLNLRIKLKNSLVIGGRTYRKSKASIFCSALNLRSLETGLREVLRSQFFMGKVPTILWRTSLLCRWLITGSVAQSLWRYPNAICTQSWVMCSGGPVWTGRLNKMTSSGPSNPTHSVFF